MQQTGHTSLPEFTSAATDQSHFTCGSATVRSRFTSLQEFHRQVTLHSICGSSPSSLQQPQTGHTSLRRVPLSGHASLHCKSSTDRSRFTAGVHFSHNRQVMLHRRECHCQVTLHLTPRVPPIRSRFTPLAGTPRVHFSSNRPVTVH